MIAGFVALDRTARTVTPLDLGREIPRRSPQWPMKNDQ